MMVRDIFPISITTIEDDAFDDLHSLQWLKLWNNDLQTLHYELMEPVLDTLIHLDIHSRTILNHIFSSQCWVSVSQCDIPRKKINQLFLQAILWCVTVRWGGTRGGTMMAGRSVLSYWYALMSFDMLWYALICFDMLWYAFMCRSWLREIWIKLESKFLSTLHWTDPKCQIETFEKWEKKYG